MSYTWLKKRGKTWHLCFAKSTGLKARSLHTTDKTAALEVQRRYESELWAQAHGIKRRMIERLRYSELVLRFIEHKQAVGVKSVSDYLRVLNRFGTFLQTDLYADAIKAEDIEKYLSMRRTSLRQCDIVKSNREGKILKPKSIRNEALTLTCFFRWAVDRDLLAENPMKRVAMPQRVVYDSRRALTQSEYLQVRENIAEEYRDVLDLYLLTGLRRSEGLGVRSENFNFETMTATFYQGKTGRHKTLPISSDLAQVARRLIAKVGIGRSLIQVGQSALTVNFRKAVKKAGLPSTLTFHSLRHTFASWLAQAGVDFKTLQSLTGHRSSQALELYVHSFDPNRRSAIEKLRIPSKAAYS